MRLEVLSLSCVRGGRLVFEGLEFALGHGEAALLTGPNGAGKTSLLRLIAGLLHPAHGTITLEGGDPEATVGEQCHYLGHLNGVKRALTVAENARFWARYLGGAAVEGALDRVALGGLADVPAGLLSSGQARRLGLARLLLAPRPLWLLDEPSVSLDAESANALTAMMRDHVRGGGLLIASSHAPLGLAFDRRIELGPEAGAA